MFNRLKLSHRILILVMVPMIFELVLVGRIEQLLSQVEREAQRLAHARAITSSINQILRTILTSAGGMGAYVVSAESSYESRSERDQHNFMVYFDNLESLTHDDPDLYARVVKMRKIAQRGTEVLARIKKIVNEDNRIMAIAEMRKVSPLLSTITAQADEITSQQASIEASSPQIQEEKRLQLHWLLMLGAVLNVLLALGLALTFNRGFTRRLRTLMDNTYRFAIGVPLNPALTGSDELARLDEVFHKMVHVIEESTRKERAVVENSVDVICSLDADEKFSKVSPASSTAWGFAPHELVGKRFSEIIFPDDRDATRSSIKELIKDNQNRQVECRIVKRDGGAINVLWSMHWSPQEQSLFCVAHDITEQRRIDRLKQEFVSMVSHDLRTPLSSIKGTLSLISEGVYDPQTEVGKKRILDAEVSIDRLVNLIGDVLDIEKLEAGEMVVEKDVVSLIQVVDESIEAVRGVAEKKNIEVIKEIIDKSDATSDVTANLEQQGETNGSFDLDVLGDNDRLVQVLVNLLSNAIKFSPENSIVKVAATADGAFNELRVTDQGRGVPPEKADIIFERFKQTQTSDGKREKGTGLGLAICKAIVAAHSGTIRVESGTASGSTFVVRLPRYEDPEDLRTGQITTE